ncbi:hypothetical protein Acsp04_04000 [Actinomadura sp. NBRC 104425]|uniref:hypothetical protein n=1 Tax=Actinomadura sp. NBRC 104425 TaxID=3032204 RepID=UPI0024A4D8B1|nr:hypothetical protein [Actinomadura sp. NBRC 104425]GLZ10165.1 hypothetical protein Acsp04_04000 [Actinomadura sp. NBRC 104425]
MDGFERDRLSRFGWARKPPNRMSPEELEQALTFLESCDMMDDPLAHALAAELVARMAARILWNGNGRPTALG